MVSECLKNEITKLHLIILVCSVEAGVNNTDVEAMEKLIETFGDEANTIICITRSEEMNRESREKNR